VVLLVPTVGGGACNATSAKHCTSRETGLAVGEHAAVCGGAGGMVA
jgi:hypothetical protein